jgi:hypothetical protein
MSDIWKDDKLDVRGAAAAVTLPALTCLPSAISEVRIRGAFGSYHICWDGEIHDLDLPPLEISDGPYMTFRGALRAARRKVRKDRRELHEKYINAQWNQQS